MSADLDRLRDPSNWYSALLGSWHCNDAVLTESTSFFAASAAVAAPFSDRGSSSFGTTFSFRLVSPSRLAVSMNASPVLSDVARRTMSEGDWEWF